MIDGVSRWFVHKKTYNIVHKLKGIDWDWDKEGALEAHPSILGVSVL